MRDTPDIQDARWRKASRSDHQGGACVEVASVASAVGVRDSKDPDGPKLLVPVAEWQAFMRRVGACEYDLP